MAKSKSTKKAKAKAKSKAVGPGGVNLQTLDPNFDFAKSVQIWKGAPGTGKTTTAAALGVVAEECGIEEEVNPFFILYEKGSGGATLNCTQQQCPDCEGSGCESCGDIGNVRMVMSDLKQMHEWHQWAATSPFNPIVIDTANEMYRVLTDNICVRNGVDSPGRAQDQGVTWGDIFNEFRDLHAELVNGDKGVIYLTHLYERTRRLRGGGELTEQVVHLSGQTGPWLTGAANTILHFDVVPAEEEDSPDKRIITCSPYAGIEAKDQFGVYPDELDRGDSEETAAREILDLFYEL